MSASIQEQAFKRLTETPGSKTKLRRGDFETTNGTVNERTRIARYQAPNPLALRTDAPARIVFVAHESFTTDGTAGNTETFNLGENLIESPNTDNFVLYEGSSIVAPDAVSYSGDSFDYTDDGTSNTLHAYYVPRDPVKIAIEKTAPPSEGNLSYTVFDGVTSIVHSKNQNKEPIEFDANHPLDLVVPKKWHLDVYADGPVAFEWSESTDGTVAINALLSVPIVQAKRDVEGLEQAVKQQVIDPASKHGNPQA